MNTLVQRKLTVAVINDNRDVAEAAGEIFEDRGHKTIARIIDDFGPNGEVLDDFLETHKPDAIVCDIGNPHVDTAALDFLTSNLPKFREGHRRVVVTTTARQLIIEGGYLPDKKIPIFDKPIFAFDDLIREVERPRQRVEGQRPRISRERG
jgi:CheY-like chemotaxis protein